MENTSTSTALVPVSFPNGNSVVGPNVLEYAKRYQTFLNQTAESILALTETVYEASINLSVDEFSQFQEEVGLNSKSTLSKFLAIGKNVNLLRPYSNRLPYAWTTLYKLVRMKSFQFDQIKDHLNTEMTAADIMKLLGRPPKKAKKDNADIKLYLHSLLENEKQDFVFDLKRLMTKYKISHNISARLNAEIGKWNQKQAA